MLEKVYNSWEIVVMVSTIIGVVSVLIGFGKFLCRWDKLNKFIRIVCTGVLVIVCALILDIGLVYFQFTEVPDVCGVTLREAREKIHNAGLSFAMNPGVNYDENRTSEVIGQSVDAYTVVQKESKVTVYIQSELAEIPDVDGMIFVPNVVGMEQIEATELLTESGLQFQVWWTEENNIEAEQYYIISQSIPADSEVPAGTLVKLELSPNKP